jgi:hypothetical protein
MASEAVPGDNMYPPIPPTDSKFLYLLVAGLIEVFELPQKLRTQFFGLLFGVYDYNCFVRISRRWYLPNDLIRRHVHKKLLRRMIKEGGELRQFEFDKDQLEFHVSR